MTYAAPLLLIFLTGAGLLAAGCGSLAALAGLSGASAGRLRGRFPRSIVLACAALVAFAGLRGKIVLAQSTTPSVSLSVSPSSGVLAGQTVTLLASETPTLGIAEGYSWTIYEDGNTLVSNALPNGVSGAFTMTSPALSAGLHSFLAAYSSTHAGYSTGNSNTIVINVGLEPSTTTLTASSASVNQNGSVTFTATVTAPNGVSTAGTVQFMNGSTVLGNSQAASSSAGTSTYTYTTTSLPVGTDSITAVSSASAGAAGSTSNAVQVVVAAAGTPPTQGTATENVLYSFCAGGAQCPDNASPLALIQANDGNFYGVDSTGGTNTNGEFFKMTPAGAVTTLYSFCNQGGSSCTDGQYPNAVVLGGDGNFYGVTTSGGTNGAGTIFKVTASGTLTTLYSFCSQGGSSCTDGSFPQTLIQGSDGNFYGTTRGASVIAANGQGTVFKITPSGTLTTLYTFCSQGGSACTDGFAPLVLVQGSDGNFYGVTSAGGATGYTLQGFAPGAGEGGGTIFKITPSGTLATLYTFCQNGQSASGCADGAVPSDLVEGSDGNFYGTTQLEGNISNNSVGSGTAFKVTPSGNFTTLYTFCSQSNCDDGSEPVALIEGSDGNFYGVSGSGGVNGSGTAFELTSSGSLTTLYSFCPANDCDTASHDASQPDFLVQGSDGSFYGGAGGGSNQDGALFQLVPSPALSGPVQLSLSQAQVDVGQSSTLSWQVLNGASATMQQCYAFIQDGATGAGNWTGLQTGTAANGVYSGTATITPTAEGTYVYALTCGGVESGFATLTVGAAPALTISTASLPNATANASYSATLAASGGVPPYTWSVVSGNLPAGLTLAAGTGAISGTPTQIGTESFMVGVKDSESTPQTATVNLSIAVNVPPLSVTTASLPNGTVGTAYSQILAATGGVSPYAWSITTGSLPAGLSLNASTGAIAGTPTAAGTASFTVQAADSESMPQTATANLSIAVNMAAAPALTIAPTSLTFAAQNTGTTSAAQTVSLTNSGTAALSITSIAASGDFAETNNCGTSVAASSNCTISVTFTPTAGGTRTGTLTITDSASGSPQTVSLTGTGSAVTVTSSSNSLSVSAAGGSATANIQLSPAGGFSGTVNLACSIAYQGTGTATDAPTCSLSPAQVTVSSGTAASTTLTVTTTAASSARLDNDFIRFGGSTLAALLFILGVPRRRWRGWSLLAVLCIAAVSACVGCGGGGGNANNTPASPGTATGSYNVTVTATSGTATASVTLPLTVQ